MTETEQKKDPSDHKDDQIVEAVDSAAMMPPPADAREQPVATHRSGITQPPKSSFKPRNFTLVDLAASRERDLVSLEKLLASTDLAPRLTGCSAADSWPGTS